MGLYVKVDSKSLVHEKLYKRCLVQISYSIGISQLLSIFVDSYGSEQQGKNDDKISQIVFKNFDTRSGKIIQELNLIIYF